MNYSREEEDMTPVAGFADTAEAHVTIPAMESVRPNSALENEILDYVAKSKATFKSQQRDEPELSFAEKKTIAVDLLYKSRSLFLAKFGKHLKKEYLSYFENMGEDYETAYHVNRLKRYFDDNKRQIDVKNRRYQALKMLVEKGEYFSETEMMKRNPLLYENLIGQYLTEEQKKKRDNIDTTNITFVNLLLESIERDRLRNMRKVQQEKEDEVVEENDSDNDSDDNKEDRNTSYERNKSHWGEMSHTNDPHDNEERVRRLKQAFDDIPCKERQIFREEFVTCMYESFLDGKDTEFDYSTVDDNDAYDNVEMRTHDEEEKYFDSESPETVLMENVREQNDSEDELDVYMRNN